MDTSHIQLDSASQKFQCAHCGAEDRLPEQFNLARLERTTNAFVAAHRSCGKVAPAPLVLRHNGCWNKPRPSHKTFYMAQTGWTYSEDGTTRMPKVVRIFHKMTTDCQYDMPGVDPACAGCVHMNVALVLESSASR